MNKRERKRLDNEWLESIEWIGYEYIAEEMMPQPKKVEFTHNDVGEVMSNLREDIAENISNLITLDSYAKLIIKSIDEKNDRDLDYYLKNLNNFIEKLEER